MMGNYILGNIKKIKKKELENIFGMMEEFIQDFGNLISKMDQGNIVILMQVKINMVFGLMGKERNGLMKKS